MSVPSDTELNAHIRARLAEESLPRSADSQKVYAGYGEYQTCDGCGRSIESTDVLYEIEIEGANAKLLAMHLKCFETWVAESQSNPPAWRVA